MKTLDHLRATKAQARAALDTATEALARGRKFAEAAVGAVARLEAQHAKAQATAARVLADSLTQGGKHELLKPVMSEEQKILIAARTDAQTAKDALRNLEVAHGARLTAFTAAERAISNEVDRHLREELIERAKVIAHYLDEAERLGKELKYFAMAAEINSPGVIPSAVPDLFYRLEKLINIATIPINLQSLGDIPAYNKWCARREALIAEAQAA
jgi:hypothetical protein